MKRIEGPNPPYDHNFLLGSAVYSLLKDYSEETANVFHDSPYRSPYVLSEIHGVKGKKGEFWFRMGTSSEAVAKAVGRALTPSTVLNIGPTGFLVTELLMEEPIVRPGEYVTLSPILLRDEETGQSIVHDTPDYDYKKVLGDAINTQIKNHMKKEGTVRVIHFEPLTVRKRTIKGRTVLAQKGRMLLDGSDKELRFLVNHGIGNSPALGFGMVVPGIPLEQIMMIGFEKVKRGGRR